MEQRVWALLEETLYPGFPKSIVAYDFVKSVEFDGKASKIVLEIPSASEQVAEQLRLEIGKRLEAAGIALGVLEIRQPPKPRQTSSNGRNVLPNVANFVMVSSGKGGVGKTTTTVNLALALAQQGKRVGLLDSDIYGPNIPRMMGIEGVEPVFMGKRIKPIMAHGVKVMSMGSLIAPDASLIWKGAMVTQAIEQMLEDIEWGELDVLIFDMPPGTGDAQLALAQNLPITAGVCVTTPQKVALDDTVRALDMFRQLHIPIAGIVENMSGFICPETGKEYPIFGKGTTPELAQRYATRVLAEIPIEPAVREGGDMGMPIVTLAPGCETTRRYLEAAGKLWEAMQEVNAEGGVDNSAIQPTIF
ncbi:Mrp/NBP35 family ATP-binding protein [Nitratifractor salsuginis]|uniref:Iron-sulfur cluster carrier protein n=1 Tax=Nitratifractor salsuginis (strain DSM 16511 / JCM 12458 / E9I37-1) TaxID=749222 RepID=E6X210_NITSE|nr:Mrp/NBP35 family ATP-binding protein [Nitratifractor salsuginis]ADV47079.1 ATPase-like, ParA/MinD [Nitratifractor salsuginis DSM 16511]